MFRWRSRDVREWRAVREYYTEYLPREMPLAAPPTTCQGPIAYKGQALLEKDLATFKAALQGVDVVEAFVPAIAPAMVGRGQNRYYPTEEAIAGNHVEGLADPQHAPQRGQQIQKAPVNPANLIRAVIPEKAVDPGQRLGDVPAVAPVHGVQGLPRVEAAEPDGSRRPFRPGPPPDGAQAESAGQAQAKDAATRWLTVQDVVAPTTRHPARARGEISPLAQGFFSPLYSPAALISSS